MKFFSVAVFALLVCSVTVYGATISIDTDGLREALKCGENVFAELAKEHKELEKYYIEFKQLVSETNTQLDECEKIENFEAKEQCTENAVLVFAMIKMTELTSKIEKESEVLAQKVTESLTLNCQ